MRSGTCLRSSAQTVGFRTMVTEESRLQQRVRPAGPAFGHQRWNDLLFLHWQVDPTDVQATLPRGLTVDTHAGAAYLGIVPFFMERIRPRWLPPVPWLSWFLELNVRTYVHDDKGRPGVFFYSLDCNQPVAVWLARRLFHLPYQHARMRATRNGSHFDYVCQRTHPSSTPARYVWAADDGVLPTDVGSLEFFLVERYLLFTSTRRGQLKVGQVHHKPYRVGRAHVTQHSVEPAKQAGFALAGPPVSALHAAAVDVEVFPLRSI